MTTTLLNNALALDPSLEHEVEVNTQYGMTVFVQLVDGTMWLMQNVTEVHWRFKSDWQSGERVAFESDVHSQGFTHEARDILVCTMRPADKRHTQFKVYR